MDRRRFIAGLSALAYGLGDTAGAQPVVGEPFTSDQVRNLARKLADSPYKQPDRSLSKEFAELSYDKYRDIRFRPENALWRDSDLPFEVQFFHRGFLFRDRVDVYTVEGGLAHPIRYTEEHFDFGGLRQRPQNRDMGFAGFRVHAPIMRPDYYDEVGAFLGASYFRAVARNQVYGLSARALSISTGNPKGEEFPAFRAFWIERPTRQSESLVVHALVDSKSASAAVRFKISPGETTVFDVEMSLFPREEITQVGIGSLTSMFLFGPNDRIGIDDYRQEVHDSDGLLIVNGARERIWRPLANPRDLQVSLFADKNPRKFGLCQRERDFKQYEDTESRFEKRPSAWVEPVGEWGEGAVQLIEIPSKEEIHDNIVAFWRPKNPIRAKEEKKYSYRLSWGFASADENLAEIVKTRIGSGPNDTRRFVLDIRGAALRRLAPDSLRAVVNADKGELRNLTSYQNPVTGGIRVSFELVPKKEQAIELRGYLVRDSQRISEIWLYRWTQ